MRPVERCEILDEVRTAYEISDDALHVWIARMEGSSRAIQALAGILSDEERRRAARFRFEADYQRHVVGRALTRILLGKLLHRRPGSLQFRCNDFGKPFLSAEQNERHLRFNVSHSGDVVLVAVVVNREIGVDVECVPADLEIGGIAARFLSPREQSDLATVAVAEQRDAFFRCWTRKEAFLKARGDGLSLPLDQFDMSLVPGRPAMVLATRPDSREAGRWVIRDLDVGPAYKAAVAVTGGGWRLETMHWRPSS